MTLYHGSNIAIDKIDLNKCRLLTGSKQVVNKYRSNHRNGNKQSR